MIYDFEEIGKQLRKRRLEQQKEIEDIVEEIKIAEDYLKAIEEGNIKDLPSMIYYNLFVRSYAKELGLDADKFLDSYASEEPTRESGEETSESKEKITAGHEIAKETTPSRPKGQTSNVVVFLWVAAIIIVIATIVVLMSMKDDETETETATTTEQTEGDHSDSIMAMADSLSVDSLVNDEAVDTVAAEPVMPEMKLKIDISESCWILVISDGDTVLHRTLDSGSTRTLTARTEYNISIGNPPGLSMQLDGQPLRSLSPSGRPISNVIINQENKEGYYLDN